MKKNKGFTLVELLAVIAILAILVIIALPNVMGMFNQAKKDSFTTELKEIYKVAQQQWMSDSLMSTGNQTYSRCSNCTGKSLQLTGRQELEYYIKLDKSGKVVNFYATDGTYQFSYDGDLLATQINDVEEVAKLDEDDVLVIDSNGRKKNVPNYQCTYNGELIQGAEYVNGQYTYRYKQESAFNKWNNIDDDGWGVILTDKNSTDDVTTKLCTTINGKPIVSMAYMFYGTQANNINFKSFETSHVTNMSQMLAGRVKVKELDLSSFDTSNVTNMSSMFAYAQGLTYLDVSSFNTSKVTNMSQMFAATTALKELDLSHFDTSNVTNMYEMFYTTAVKNLDISSFNTSKVTNMYEMFDTFVGETITFGNGFNTSNITNMEEMFYRANNLKQLDLSHFDTSNVTNMRRMFASTNFDIYDLSSFDMSKVSGNGCSIFRNEVGVLPTAATARYAKTEADAAKLKCEEFTFTVK